MPDVSSTVKALEAGAFDNALLKLYLSRAVTQKQRYIDAVSAFASIFGVNRNISLFSAPGRTEIGGNHTDHQRGCVIAAAVNLDIICVVGENRDGVIRIHSKGHKQADVDLLDLSPKENEKDKSISIVRGIAARCRALGYHVGGFDAYTTSDVLRGSGLSSSAAFETAIGTIISYLFNEGKISPVEIAKIGSFAENVYYGKPSGLMDQMASSVGGLITINFSDVENPAVTPVDFDFASCGHSLCIVDTKGDHANLTSEYAAIPAEMRSIASHFGKDVLSEVDESFFFASIPILREKYGDRAVLRALHFFSETKKPEYLSRALEEGDFGVFKKLIIASGDSSLTCLQNGYSNASPDKQGIVLSLALSKKLLEGKGAWRLHGGGFAGTIQAFVPDSMLDTYAGEIEGVFGPGSCHKLQIRSAGGVRVTDSA